MVDQVQPARVVIDSEFVERRDITTKAGDSMSFATQEGYLLGRGVGCLPISLDVRGRDGVAYPVGAYEIGGGSFDIGDYGRLRITFSGVVLFACAEGDKFAARAIEVVEQVKGVGLVEGIVPEGRGSPNKAK